MKNVRIFLYNHEYCNHSLSKTNWKFLQKVIMGEGGWNNWGGGGG